MNNLLENYNIEILSDTELYELVNRIGLERSLYKKGTDSLNSRLIDSFFSIHMLEADVFNGGFDQFFANGGYENHCELALWGIAKIGGLEISELLNKAIDIHLKSNDSQKHERNHDFDNLDDLFYDMDEYYESDLTKLNTLIVSYVRKMNNEL